MWLASIFFIFKKKSSYIQDLSISSKSYLNSKISYYTWLWDSYKRGDISFYLYGLYLFHNFREYISKVLECGAVYQTPSSTELVYYCGSKKYKVRFPKNKTRRQISSAYTGVDKDKVDVTHELMEFLGPCYDFHSIPTTPKLLGWNDGVTISYFKQGISEERTFGPDEFIDIYHSKPSFQLNSFHSSCV
jgi:hypothetical protein